MKQIHSFKAYSGSSDTLIASERKEQDTLNRNVPAATLKNLGSIKKGK